MLSSFTLVITGAVSLVAALVSLREILKKLFYNSTEVIIVKLVVKAELRFGAGCSDEKFLSVCSDAHKILPTINQLVYSISDIAEIVEKVVKIKFPKSHNNLVS